MRHLLIFAKKTHSLMRKYVISNNLACRPSTLYRGLAQYPQILSDLSPAQSTRWRPMQFVGSWLLWTPSVAPSSKHQPKILRRSGTVPSPLPSRRRRDDSSATSPPLPRALLASRHLLPRAAASCTVRSCPLPPAHAASVPALPSPLGAAAS